MRRDARLFKILAGLALASLLFFNMQFILGGSVPPAHASDAVTITSIISSSSDDAEEFLSNGWMYLNSSDLELVTDGKELQDVGMRFTGLNIPPGATITGAYLTFTVDELQSEATNLSIYAQADDNAPTFGNNSHDLSTRPRTAAKTDWLNLPAWTTLDAKITTPDLSGVVQEIINRPGWVANNALAFIVTGSGHRTAVAFDLAPLKAPLLTITYIGPAVATSTPTLTPTVFIAPTLAPGSIRFAVIGDYGSGDEFELAVANLVKRFSPDFITTVGDNNYPDGAATTIDTNIGQFYSNYIFPYLGAYGSSATSNNFFPVPGNHDWYAPNLKPYLDYFTLPNNERYYDFVRGPVHFFMLDSETGEPDGITSTSIQAGWLKNGLAASTSPFQLVLMHTAPYSSGLNHGSDPTVQWPFAVWGADAVLAGHEHLYERLSVDGIPYFVNGAGGGNLYPIGTLLPQSLVRYNQKHGAMIVDANASAATFSFYNVDNLLIDSFTITYSAPQPTATFTPTPTATNTPLPTFTFTPLPSSTNTPLPTFTFTPLPTSTDTPLPTASNTPLPTSTFTPLPTATNTPLPTFTFTPLPTSTDTPLPTVTNTPLPTSTFTPLPTATDTPLPTFTFTPLPPTATYTPLPSSTPVYPTISIKPVADAYVDARYPNTNYGANSQNKSDGSPVQITYLKFDLAPLAGKTILSAKLRMYVTDKTASIQNIKSVSDTTWLETGLTYNKRPAVGPLLASFNAPAKSIFLSVDLTSAVTAGAGGLISLGIDSAGADAFYFSSRSSALNSPSLEVTYR